MQKLIQTMAAIAVGVMSAGPAFATSSRVPQPGTWALIGIGLAAAIAVGRRKK